jgi:hypothetical protein
MVRLRSHRSLRSLTLLEFASPLIRTGVASCAIPGVRVVIGWEVYAWMTEWPDDLLPGEECG